jgi:hypothetical protein
MKQFILLVLVAIIATFTACRTDFDTVASSGNLEFSKSKIYLDTIFNNIGSSTYGLKVYNRSNSDIKIPTIQFGKGMSSKYRMMVDGMTGNQGKIFNNVELLAKDSLFIFIEITNNVPSPTQLEFTYDDQILFDVGANQQKVDLTTLIWDANFIFPNRPLPTDLKEKLRLSGISTSIEGHLLSINEHWTKDKPYVIYGYAQVPNGGILTIDPGTRVYFHADSGIIVDEGGTININGTPSTSTTNNEVSFEGDRLEPNFEDVPGQWGTVWVGSNSTNSINHLTLKNATVGLLIQKITTVSTILPNLQIKDTKFYNCSNFGILARNSNITGKNLVVNYSGQACFAGVLGGNYNFTHCTFNSNWQSTAQRAVILNNHIDGDLVNSISLTSNFKNCIMYGTNPVEIKLDLIGTFVRNFDHCLFKFNDPDNKYAGGLYDFITTPTNGNIKGQDPKFKNTTKNKLMPLTITSGAYRKAVYDPDPFLVNDIDGNLRETTTPRDIGAYNIIP